MPPFQLFQSIWPFFATLSTPASVVAVAYLYSMTFIVGALALAQVPQNFAFNKPREPEAFLALLVNIAVSAFSLGGMITVLFLRSAKWFRPWQLELSQSVMRSLGAGSLVLIVKAAILMAEGTQTYSVVDVPSGHVTVVVPLTYLGRLCIRGVALDAVAIKAGATLRGRILLHTCNLLYTLTAFLPQIFQTEMGLARWGLIAFASVMLYGHIALLALFAWRMAAPASERRASGMFVAVYIICAIAQATIASAFGPEFFFDLISPDTLAAIGCLIELALVVALGALVTGLQWKTEEEVRVQLAQTQVAFDKHRKFMRYICHELRVPLQSISLAAEEAYEHVEIAQLEPARDHRSGASGKACNDTGMGMPLAAAPHVRRCSNSSSSGSMSGYSTRNNLTLILSATSAMSKLLDDTLHLSKIEAGMLVLEVGAFQPVALVQDVMDTFQAQLRRKGLSCALSVAPGVPNTVSSDSGRLRQILCNFVSNALKFTGAGGNIVFRLSVLPSNQHVPTAASIRDNRSSTASLSSATRSVFAMGSNEAKAPHGANTSGHSTVVGPTASSATTAANTGAGSAATGSQRQLERMQDGRLRTVILPELVVEGSQSVGVPLGTAIGTGSATKQLPCKLQLSDETAVMVTACPPGVTAAATTSSAAGGAERVRLRSPGGTRTNDAHLTSTMLSMVAPLPNSDHLPLRKGLSQPDVTLLDGWQGLTARARPGELLPVQVSDLWVCVDGEEGGGHECLPSPVARVTGTGTDKGAHVETSGQSGDHHDLTAGSPRTTPTNRGQTRVPKLSSGSASLGPSFLLFEVQDDGVGIDAADQEKLFKPFEQIKAGALQKGNGTGLGLSICKHIIGRLGGEIGCVSAEGKGSRFWFTVPLTAPAETIPAPALNTGTMPLRPTSMRAVIPFQTPTTFQAPELTVVPVPAATVRPEVAGAEEAGTQIVPVAGGLSRANGTIPASADADTDIDTGTGTCAHAVVVDDTGTNREMLARLLRRMGFARVTTAVNGVDALSHPEWLSADVWLVDRNMPVMGGEELTQRVRASGFKGIMIGVSGDAIDGDRDKFVAAGLNALVMKPVTRGGMESVLKAHGVVYQRKMQGSEGEK